jgi:hypothetical protein
VPDGREIEELWASLQWDNGGYIVAMSEFKKAEQMDWDQPPKCITTLPVRRNAHLSHSFFPFPPHFSSPGGPSNLLITQDARRSLHLRDTAGIGLNVLRSRLSPCFPILSLTD